MRRDLHDLTARHSTTASSRRRRARPVSSGDTSGATGSTQLPAPVQRQRPGEAGEGAARAALWRCTAATCSHRAPRSRGPGPPAPTEHRRHRRARPGVHRSTATHSGLCRGSGSPLPAGRTHSIPCDGPARPAHRCRARRHRGLRGCHHTSRGAKLKGRGGQHRGGQHREGSTGEGSTGEGSKGRAAPGRAAPGGQRRGGAEPVPAPNGAPPVPAAAAPAAGALPAPADCRPALTLGLANQRRSLRIGRRGAKQRRAFCHAHLTDICIGQSAGGPAPQVGGASWQRGGRAAVLSALAEAMVAPGDTDRGGAGSRPGPGSGRPPPGDLRSALITSVLNLERLELDLFRGRHHWVPATQRLFGGQIVGQALVAAARSVSRDEQVHSLHCYFVRAGDPKVPVLYEVERTRTGKSFSVRSVKAIQHGKPIFTCQASFQLSQGSPLQHQFTMPSVPPPEDLLTQEELIQKFLQNPNLAERYRKHLTKIQAEDVPIDIKPVNPPDTFYLESQEPKQFFWVRARGYIGETDMKVHCCVAAYISDYAFLGTALLPHRQYHIKFMVSLDHSMWFHAPFRADHWMLYECESPWAGGCRGLVQGRLWRKDGVLAVTCAQEGVIRVEEMPTQSKL